MFSQMSFKQSLENDLLKKDGNEGSRTATIMSQGEHFSNIIQMTKTIIMVYTLSPSQENDW